MKNKILFLIIIIALFFYTFNLYYTYFFSGDMARDTLASLRILKNKEITVIGPPISFGQYGIREVYFSSLTYYVGALGLVLTNLNVLGPVYVNIILMIIGLYFLYLFGKDFFKNEKKALIMVFLYSLSPPIVAHLRFFWNPNFIISIAPIYWYFYYKSLTKKDKLSYFFTGIVAGILFLFHYFVLPIIIFSLFFLIKKKTFKKIFFLFFGFLIIISPLIFFEIKNQFYLTKAIIFNLTENAKFSTSYKPIFSRPLILKFLDIFQIPVIFIGTQTEATHFYPILNLNYSQTVILGFIIFLILIFKNLNQKNDKINAFIFIFIFTSLISSLLAHEFYYLRYFFIGLPIFSLLFTNLINKKNIIVLSIIFLITNTRILYSQKAHNDLIKEKGTAYPTLSHIEKVAKIIEKEKFKLPYNITENFIGDARALYLRFFIEKNIKIAKPNNEISYTNLKTLFVFAPSLEVIKKEGRWEFLATPNLKLTKQYKIDNNKYLFKFEAE
jgi:4-amino-4-deoxy-L-arabinose transferase-like glycosyltransferase